MKPRPEPQPAYVENVVWVPGQGADPGELRSLAEWFTKPKIPAGEAWFMSKPRYLYDDLNALPFEKMEEERVRDYLDELTLGLYCFPGMAEWDQWYGYLAPRIVGSSRFEGLEWHSTLCTGLLGLAWYDPAAEVLRREAAFARVLVFGLMEPQYWSQGSCRLLRDKGWRMHRRRSFTNDTGIFILLLFAWRYITPAGMRAWLSSAFAIEDVLWRAHLVRWLTEVFPIIAQQRSDYEVIKQCGIHETLREFYGSNFPLFHCPEALTWNLIPVANIVALGDALREELEEGDYLNWIDGFAAYPDLWPEVEWRLEQLLGNLQKE